MDWEHLWTKISSKWTSIWWITYQAVKIEKWRRKWKSSRRKWEKGQMLMKEYLEKCKSIRKVYLKIKKRPSSTQQVSYKKEEKGGWRGWRWTLKIVKKRSFKKLTNDVNISFIVLDIFHEFFHPFSKLIFNIFDLIHIFLMESFVFEVKFEPFNKKVFKGGKDIFFENS